jgi:site-specific DNA-methyltransferase (adenine-specific)
LGHVVDREKAKIGVFITFAEPMNPINIEAIKAEFYETPYGKFPKLQIYTIQELFAGAKPKTPLD